MATNKAIERAVSFPVAVPTTCLSGDLVVVGNMAAVLETSYNALTGKATASFEGAYFLTVSALSSESPAVNSAVKPGDKLYLNGGTLDATTNVTTGGTLDKNSAGTFVGFALDAITAGQTATIRVRLKVGA